MPLPAAQECARTSAQRNSQAAHMPRARLGVQVGMSVCSARLSHARCACECVPSLAPHWLNVHVSCGPKGRPALGSRCPSLHSRLPARLAAEKGGVPSPLLAPFLHGTLRACTS
eukprot:12281119-Alexandrium_andersonii.AAC.1